MERLVIGILAHVDAGKTTLSESILYVTGSIKKLGRVDHKNAFLDTNEIERERGITIFSKQAEFILGNKSVTLLDTPGHVDFSAEMERTLQVLDYAILVINASDDIRGHVMTLWKLLKRYNIPTFLFINKMDQEQADKDVIKTELSRLLSDSCIDFGSEQSRESFFESLAMCDETIMNRYLEDKDISEESIAKLIEERKVFPCYFGSALKLDGIDAFLEGMRKYLKAPVYGKDFGAKVFKISRDKQGNRLTHMKVTGGELKVKEFLTKGSDSGGGEKTDQIKTDSGKKTDQIKTDSGEKVDQIRIYSGEKYRTVSVAGSGTVCSVTGLNGTYAGEGFGISEYESVPVIESVLNYKILLPSGCDIHGMLTKLRILEEEAPQLHIVWNEELSEIHAKVMGEVEIEILKRTIEERFGVKVDFCEGNLVYKETITNTVEGVGHFEPLKHYAEVHLVMEPAPRGSGLQLQSDCNEDVLGRNWQKLVLMHLAEKKHPGVLIGAEITDMKITLVAGRMHQKHTEGGDFRQATYRAVRQGLKKANSIILEPFYDFTIEVPVEFTGRALSDIQRMHASAEPPEMNNDIALITGCGPVATMKDYSKTVTAYSGGRGKFLCTIKGYEPCHNCEEVMLKKGYDSERDVSNPTGSIFCFHGAGTYISWDKVDDYMHIDAVLKTKSKDDNEDIKEVTIRQPKPSKDEAGDPYYDEKELELIFERTYGSMKREINRLGGNVNKPRAESHTIYKGSKKYESKDKYLLVDGYNIIFAWEDLAELAKINLDAARGRLMDILSNYQGYKDDTLILVFDAYKVKGNPGEIINYNNIKVIYTKEAETADQYIEKVVHKIGRKYDVTVATSDALEQMIVWGQGAKRLSARGLKEEIEAANSEIREHFLKGEES